MEPLRRIDWKSSDWPRELANITPRPDELWLRGKLDRLEARPRVAIVGSRAATPYGLLQAERFARELARAGVCIVSGLARGVDQAAHRGALEAGGATIAVLGCGVDCPWPKGEVTDRMTREGLLLSEFQPGSSPRRHHFPLRNRLISCLSSGVLVIEAAGKSGSLITARWALDQGRPVYALPGRIDHPMATGILRLLKDGATPVGSPADLLEDLFELLPPEVEPVPSDPLLEALAGETLSLDELAVKVTQPLGDTLARLLELEMAGAIARCPGGLYRLNR